MSVISKEEKGLYALKSHDFVLTHISLMNLSIRLESDNSVFSTQRQAAVMMRKVRDRQLALMCKHERQTASIDV